ncbi:DNL-type zinc finger protein [Aspergillus aculeatinus CBS 121060]|uniref:Zf-DNL-domain-containing protein n=1 Tax=Aspergillus aculeatinus CBS 121060 TaxID=1448322 RepID=A0ACD1HIW3_9EURO|nr:zf-DNL-domain-containing protein [Aspergillus aculeatinus CBS 121060]RAH73384.1 zf-DNL-domain-containing protein [Aspergillus aculeatinus CBS 121060]
MRSIQSLSHGLRALTQRSLPRAATISNASASAGATFLTPASSFSSISASASSRTFTHLAPSSPLATTRTTTKTTALLSARHNSTTTTTTSQPDPTATTEESNTSTNESNTNTLTDRHGDAATDAAHAEQNRLRREQEPAYQITFTCKPCGGRSSHRMSKHGYHRGTVLIQCPTCSNRHVIADHLNIFFDEKSTLEDILARQGDKLMRGYTNGDMEFWENGEGKEAEAADGKNKGGEAGQAQSRIA